MAEDFLVDCCFKVGHYGSIIHDKLNARTKKLVKYSQFIDTTVLRHQSDGYNPRYYSPSEDIAATSEAFMFKFPQMHFNINVANKWYSGYTYDKAMISYTDLEAADKDRYVTYSDIFDLSGFVYVGIELTDVINLRYPPWIYRICYKDGYIYTSKGIFPLPIPFERLTGWRNDMKLYAELRYQDTYFGYLFVDTGYVLLYITEDGKLEWEERKL